MKIAAIRLYGLPIRFKGGGYRTSYGHRERLDAVLLVLESVAGAVGYGEVPRLFGNSPIPLLPTEVARFEKLLRPALGAPVQQAMHRLPREALSERNLCCGLETAALDALARHAGLPLNAFLGGTARETVACYETVGQTDPDETKRRFAAAANAGFEVFQIKVGGALDEDIARVEAALAAAGPETLVLADANGGWSVETARQAAAAIPDPRVLWEEPCKTYAENRDFVERTGAPVVMDQCMGSLKEYAQLCADGFAAGTGIKSAIQGGPSNARLARDLCIAHGIRMKLDDSWCVDVGTALSLELALGVPEPLLICGADMRLYFEDRIAPDGPIFEAAQMRRGGGAGHGVTPDVSTLGQPLAEIV